VDASNPSKPKWARAVRVGTVALILLLGGGLLWFRWSRPEGVRAKFEKIRAGMTEREVEDLLGGPPGFYGEQPSPPKGGLPIRVGLSDWNIQISNWYFPGDRITVQFDNAGIVRWKTIDPPTQFDRAREWITSHLPIP
jgi:hypothetical protein